MPFAGHLRLHRRQASQNAAIVHRAFCLALIPQGMELVTQMQQLSDASIDVAEVFIQ